MADGDDAGGSDAGWTVRLREVERLEPDEDDLGEDYFAVEFELSGLGVSGTLTAMVTGPADETTIITEALDQLRNGLEIYARVVGRREGLEPVSDAADREASGALSLPARVEAVELLMREVAAVLPGRSVAVDRARLGADALERQAVLSGDQDRQEHAAAVRTALERLTE